ncbi:MAG TPA: response regulator transcription factor [Gaiellaceae bacterium]|nr:response regulator transcription factor [Gaiellaceae bacterium]
MEEGRRRGAQRTSYLALADSFTLFRFGLRIVIGEAPDFEVSEAGSLEDLEALLSAGYRPDLALVDLDLPPSGATDAVTLLHRNHVAPIVWASRHRLSSDLVFDLVRAGAVGVLPKEISPTGLLRALRGVLDGEAPLGRDVASMLVSGLQSANATAGVAQQLTMLSSRELEVLDLVADGRANKEIAARLELSEFTVKRHIQNILRKIGARSRLEASASYLAQRREAPARIPLVVSGFDGGPSTEPSG